MPVCAVNICRISSTDAENRSEVVSFHCFPKEKTRRARWLKFCGLHNDTGKSLYICSQHFPRESFANNATIQKMLNPQGGARNLLIKNVDPSIRKPSAPEEECTARAAQQYRKQRKAVVAALLEAHENGAIEERHLLETHNRGEIGEKTLCDFECSIQQPFAVQPLSFQTEANFVDPNRTLLPMPQQLLSHNEQDLVGYGKTLVPVSQEPHSRIEVDSGTNMDVLFTAIEIHQTVNAGTFATDNTPTDIGGPLNHPAPFDSCVPSEDAPADSKNDSGWASFEAHSNLESTRMEGFSAFSENSQVKYLKDRVKQLKSTVQSKNERIRSLRKRVMKNNKHFLALLKTMKEKNNQIKQNDKQLAEKSETIDELRKACAQLNEIREKDITDRVEEVLKGVFTRNQIDLILKKKKKVTWTADEIAKSFSLR